mmetsp:Transcript_13170/g.30793  ORF Transcript_13170/g.30793 Transcript_13170/m.30793 type:complete len:201 (-) Transcript_13170:707-1309(-)
MRLFAVETALVASLACTADGASSGAFNSSFYAVFKVGNLNSSLKSGSFVLQVNTLWAPRSAARLWHLLQSGFFDNTWFYRAVKDFVVQFGAYGDPDVIRRWSTSHFKEDKAPKIIRWRTNMRGRIGFAQPLLSGPGVNVEDFPGATTELYLNLGHNVFLDERGFLPVAEVLCGMDYVDSIYAIGDFAPNGGGPDQERLRL